MSDGEELLAFQLTAAGIPFAREVRFHPTRRWRLDFRVGAGKLGVEVEGATFARGRHTRGAGFAEDCAKGAEALVLGWRVLRVTTEQVESGEALVWIEKLMEGKRG